MQEKNKENVKHGEGEIQNILGSKLSIFGLTDIEAKIVRKLTKSGSMGVSRISRETNIPHTTIHSALRRLGKQGLVRRLSRGYFSVWAVTQAEEIQKRLDRAVHSIGSDVSRERLEKKLDIGIPETEEFLTIKGAHAMLKVYQWYFINHRNDRISNIQTTHSLETIYKKLDAESVAQLNDLVKENRIEIDIVFADGIKSFYQYVAVQNKRIAKSMEEKATSVYLIPDLFMDFNAEVIVSHDLAFVANWEYETLILIKNHDFVRLLQNLCAFLKHTGTLFNQKVFLQHLIEERGEL